MEGSLGCWLEKRTNFRPSGFPFGGKNRIHLSRPWVNKMFRRPSVVRDRLPINWVASKRTQTSFSRFWHLAILFPSRTFGKMGFTIKRGSDASFSKNAPHLKVSISLLGGVGCRPPLSGCQKTNTLEIIEHSNYYRHGNNIATAYCICILCNTYQHVMIWLPNDIR